MTHHPQIIFVYVTTPDRLCAERIAHGAVEESLAACANILGTITSVYRWEGKVEEAAETALILKTTSDGFEALAVRIRTWHPHQCPCIVALPIAMGTQDFCDWIQSAVRDKCSHK